MPPLQVYYNGTLTTSESQGSNSHVDYRLPQLVNLASKAWWRYITGGW